mmetsp:Transcript_38834/g.83627  ORF Transcript_38834/g.83627 Transcript_38834/m.83627 type:complete len:216 (+) Transcript_38834:33-680(+)
MQSGLLVTTRTPACSREYARAGIARRGALQVVASSTTPSFDVSVRPYTLRKDDSLDSIGEKRGISVKEILAMNPDVSASTVTVGKTILLPAGKLSQRDKEILGGIGRGYRVYPVRAGENLDDIISKRNISREEMEQLNPGTDLDSLKANMLLKLPTNKFTVREREMLIGSRILPPEFFQAATNPFVIGISALLMVCGFVLAWQKFFSDADYLADE